MPPRVCMRFVWSRCTYSNFILFFRREYYFHEVPPLFAKNMTICFCVFSLAVEEQSREPIAALIIFVYNNSTKSALCFSAKISRPLEWHTRYQNTRELENYLWSAAGKEAMVIVHDACTFLSYMPLIASLFWHSLRPRRSLPSLWFSRAICGREFSFLKVWCMYWEDSFTRVAFKVECKLHREVYLHTIVAF
jgi:hypothetical protein